MNDIKITQVKSKLSLIFMVFKHVIRKMDKKFRTTLGQMTKNLGIASLLRD